LNRLHQNFVGETLGNRREIVGVSIFSKTTELLLSSAQVGKSMQIVAREQIFNEGSLRKALSELMLLESKVHMENAIFMRLEQLITNALAIRAAEWPDAASLQSSVAAVLQLQFAGVPPLNDIAVD
jgi:hypothetical protein